MSTSSEKYQDFFLSLHASRHQTQEEQEHAAVVKARMEAYDFIIVVFRKFLASQTTLKPSECVLQQLLETLTPTHMISIFQMTNLETNYDDGSVFSSALTEMIENHKANNDKEAWKIFRDFLYLQSLKS